MGYKHDGYQLSLRFYAQSGAIGSWLDDRALERVVLAPLIADGFAARCSHVAVDLGDPVKLRSPDEIASRARSWKYGTYELISGDDPSSTDAYIHLDVEPSELKIFVGIGAPIARELGADLFDQLDRWVVSWVSGLPGSLELAKGTFEPTDDDYPHSSPPRQAPGWHLGTLKQYVGLRFHRADAQRSAILDRLTSEPLPAGGSRRTEGDVMILSFLDRLEGRDEINRIRAEQERWLLQVVQSEPARGWNERGDRLVGPINAVPHAPLTLWEPNRKVGYKAIVVYPDGSVDEDTWEQMAEIVHNGQLDDGTPIEALRLVVPRREDAVTILDRALAAGFEMVVYPQGAAFWQVERSPAA